MRRKPSFLVVTRDALRTYWAGAVLILAAGAVALAAVVPIFRLTQSVGELAPRLRYGTVRLSSLGFQWGSNAVTPAHPPVPLYPHSGIAHSTGGGNHCNLVWAIALGLAPRNSRRTEAVEH